jgi:putative PIN family toxin of toxin-antitoxin system
VANRRVVFDTNVLISGYLWKGSARKAIEQVRQKQWVHLISDEAVNELIRVLAYSKFGLTAAEMEPIIQDLLSISEHVNVKSQLNIIAADATDNIFLNLALDGQANVIVSGDHHLLDIKRFRDISILPIRKFLAL